MFEKIKAKKFKYWIWIFSLFVFNLFMITAMFYEVDDSCILTKLQKIFPTLIITSSIYLIQHWRYYFFIDRKFNLTVFNVYPKRKRPEKPLEIVELITFKNRIIYRYKSEPNYVGEIVLDLINLRYGKGIHYNDPLSDNDKCKNIDSDSEEYEEMMNKYYAKVDRFGFAQFIVTKDKIFVEHPYIKPNNNLTSYGVILYQATIWERTNEK